MEQFQIYSNSDFFIELLLVIIISFIGSFAHEYITFIMKNKHISISNWFNILVSTVISVIICLSIDPLIVSVHPRFIFLPPLLIGLLGTELALKLSKISGSTSMIEYVLSFFNILRSEKVAVPTDPVQENKPKQRTKRKKKEPSPKKEEVTDDALLETEAKEEDVNELLLDRILDIQSQIDILLQEHNMLGKQSIIGLYSSIKFDIDLVRDEMHKYNDKLTDCTKSRFKTLFTHERELNTIYRNAARKK